MPDTTNSLPVEITVSLNQPSVNKSFADIQAAADAAGRKIGDSLSASGSSTAISNYGKQAKAIDDVTAAMFKLAKVRSPETVARELDALRQVKAMWESLGPATEGYKGALDQITRRTNILTEGNARARGEFHQFIAKVASLTFELTAAAWAMKQVGEAFAAPALIGGKYLKELEDVKLGITGVLMAMGTMNGQALNFGQASAIAEEQVKKLSNEAMFLAGNTLDLAKAFQAVAVQGLEAGMSIDQIRTIAVAGTAAGRALGISAQTLQRDIRDMVLGIRPNSTILSASLGITKADIDAARASSEGLFGYLDGKLKGFYAAAMERNKTFSGLWEQMSEMFVRSMGQSAIPIFETAKGLIQDIMDRIGTVNKLTHEFTINPDFKRDLDAIMGSLDSMLKVIAGVIKALWDVREPLLIIGGINIGLAVWGLLEKQILRAATALGIYKVASVAVSVPNVSGGGLMLGGGAATTIATTAATTAYTSSLAGLASKASVYGMIALALYEIEKALASQLPWLQKINDAMSDYFDNVFKLGKYAPATKLDLAEINKELDRQAKIYQSILPPKTEPVIKVDNLALVSKELTNTKTKINEVNTEYELMAAAGGVVNLSLLEQSSELSNYQKGLSDTKTRLENAETESGKFESKVVSLTGSLHLLDAALKNVNSSTIQSYEKAGKNTALDTAYSTVTQQLEDLKKQRAVMTEDNSSTMARIEADKAIQKMQNDAELSKLAIGNLQTEHEWTIKVAESQGRNQKVNEVYAKTAKTINDLMGERLSYQNNLDAILAKNKIDDPVSIENAAKAKEHIRDVDRLIAAERIKAASEIAAIPDPYKTEITSLEMRLAGTKATTEAIRAHTKAILEGKTIEEAVSLSTKHSDEMEIAIKQNKFGLILTDLDKVRLLNSAVAQDEAEYVEKQAKAEDRLAEKRMAFVNEYKNHLQTINDQVHTYVLAQEAATQTIQAQIDGENTKSKQYQDNRAVDIGLGKELNEIQDKYNKLRANIQATTEDKQLYGVQEAEAIKKATKAAEDHKTAINTLATDQKDFFWSLKEGWNQYTAEIEDGSRNIASSFKSLFKSAEDALTKFIMTGKLDFKSFVNSMLSELARLAAKQIILNFTGVAGMVGASASSAGGMGNLMNAGSSLNTALTGGWNTAGSTYSNFATGQYGQMLGLSSVPSDIAAATATSTEYMATATGQLVAVGEATAEAAGTLTSLGSAIGTALPWIGVGMAALSLFGGNLFGSSGGPKTEGNAYGTIGAGGVTAIQRNASFAAPYGDGNWNRPGADAARVETLLQPVGQSIAAYINKLGGSATGLGISMGYNTDVSGTAPDNVMAGVMKASGEWAYKTVYDTERGKGLEAMQGELSKMTLAAVQSASGLSEGLLEIANSIDVTTASVAEATAVLQKITNLDTVNKILSDLNLRLFDVSLSGSAMAESLINAMGGMEKMTATTQSYYANFFTDSERHNNSLQSLTAQFSALNVAMPTTREGFRALVEQQDLSTDSGRNMVAALLNLNGAFAAVIPATESATSAIKTMTDTTITDMTTKLKTAWATMSSAGSLVTKVSGDTTPVSNMLSRLRSGYQYITNMSDQAAVLGQITDAEQQLNSVREANQVELLRTQKDAFQTQLSNAKSLLEAVKNIKNYVSGLKIGTLTILSPEQKLHEAESQYAILLAQARSGNTEAVGKLQSAADSYLTIARDYFASSESYSQIFDSVISSLDSFSTATISANESIISTLESTITGLDTAIAAQLSVSVQTYDDINSLYQSSLTAFDQQMADAARQALATDSVKTAIEQLPPELAGLFSATLATLLTQITTTAQATNTTEQWTQNNGLTSWASNAGAVGVQSPTGSVRVYSSSGSWPLEEGIAWVNAHLSDPLAIYNKARQEGVSLSSLDAMMGWAANTAEDWARSQGLPSFAVGSAYIPRDMAADIHQGEMIIDPVTSGYLRKYGIQVTSSDNGKSEEYYKAMIMHLEALVRQNGAASQAMIEELQAMKIELEEIKGKVRLAETI